MAWTPHPELSRAELQRFQLEYRKKSRFLIDESLGIEAARVMRKLGWNAVFVTEVGLSGRDDADVYAYAWRDDRILLTHDRDFLDDTRFPPHRNPGVVVLPGASGPTTPLEREIARVHLILAPYREAQRYTKIEVSSGGEWAITKWNREEGMHSRRRVRFEPNGNISLWIESNS
jgi:predicted nuclease of predicted toxin-antitoxin system